MGEWEWRGNPVYTKPAKPVSRQTPEGLNLNNPG